MRVFWTVVTPLLLAWISGGVVRRYASRFGLVATPNHRSSHERPTPSGGGIGLVIGGTVAGLWLVPEHPISLWVVMGTSVLVAAVGLRDDIEHVSAYTRLLTQLLVCGAVLLSIGGVSPLFTQSVGTIEVAGPFSLMVLMVAGIWWINLYNFMDGVDGIAGLQGAFMLLAAVFLGVWMLPEPAVHAEWVWMIGLAAAITGFLIHNWPPARIFMGDVGSTYLAFVIYALALISVGNGWMSYPVWTILGGVFVSDATITLLQRMRRGERWSEAHRSHTYQRLSRHFRSHRRVTLLAFAINVFWLFPLATASLLWADLGWTLAAVAYLPLVVGIVFTGHLTDRMCGTDPGLRSEGQ